LLTAAIGAALLIPIGVDAPWILAAAGNLLIGLGLSLALPAVSARGMKDIDPQQAEWWDLVGIDNFPPS